MLKIFPGGQVEGGIRSMQMQIWIKRVEDDRTCRLCGGNKETILHALSECTYADKVWNPVHLQCEEHSFFQPQPSSMALVKDIMDQALKSKLELFLVIVWNI